MTNDGIEIHESEWDEHLGWLRRVAERLVGDEDGAHELSHRALSVWARSADAGARQRPRPFLRGVLRRRRRLMRRSRSWFRRRRACSGS